MRHSGLGLRFLQKSFLNSLCNKSVVVQLMPDWNHSNTFMGEARHSFAQHRSSSTSSIDDNNHDAVVSNAGIGNSQLHERPVSQIHPSETSSQSIPLRSLVGSATSLSPVKDFGDDVISLDAVATIGQLHEKPAVQWQPAGTVSKPTPLCSASANGPSAPTLSHVADSGQVRMVDVGAKSTTWRVATAEGRVLLGGPAFQLVVENRLKKGDVLSAAQLAGIMAAKQTSHLIPLCHGVMLTSVDVTLTLDHTSQSVVVECTARCRGQTGVEMEALTGVSIAALTVYDMCKSVSHDIVIRDVRLAAKTGGKADFSRR